MKARNVACIIAAVSLAGLTACSGESANDADSTPVAVATSSSPEHPTPVAESVTTEADEQTIEEACLDMAGPMADASAKMSDLAQEPTDPQNAVDSWTALTDSFGEISAKVTNAEMVEASTAVYDDLSALRDEMQKVYVDGDTSAMSEYLTATQNWSTSYQTLLDLCTPETN